VVELDGDAHLEGVEDLAMMRRISASGIIGS
jgi:hypothetical protein